MNFYIFVLEFSREHWLFMAFCLAVIFVWIENGCPFPALIKITHNHYEKKED